MTHADKSAHRLSFRTFQIKHVYASALNLDHAERVPSREVCQRKLSINLASSAVIGNKTTRRPRGNDAIVQIKTNAYQRMKCRAQNSTKPGAKSSTRSTTLRTARISAAVEREDEDSTSFNQPPHSIPWFEGETEPTTRPG